MKNSHSVFKASIAGVVNFFKSIGSRRNETFASEKFSETDYQDQKSAMIRHLETKSKIDQFTAWAKHSQIMYPTGFLCMCAVLLDFKNPLQNHKIYWSSLCLTVAYLLIGAASQYWIYVKSSDSDVRTMKRYKIFMGVLRCLVSSSWAFLITVLFSVADQNQIALLDATCVAVISTSIFGGSVIYGLTFLLPTSIGFLMNLIMNEGRTGPAIIACLIFYVILTLYSLYYISAKIRDIAINGRQIQSRNAIISLFLNEFDDDASDWLWESDKDFNLQNISTRLQKIIGGPNTDQYNIRKMIVSSVLCLSGEDATHDFEDFIHKIKSKSSFRRLSLPVTIHGKAQWWLLSGKPIIDDRGSIIGYHGVGCDITEQYESRVKVKYLAEHDSVTGLYNRAYFNNIMKDYYIRISEGNSDAAGFGLMLIDLDNFKIINDTHGHIVGDKMLVEVANRLIAETRETDVVARIGGDEFTLFIPYDISCEAELIANRIVSNLCRPYILENIRIDSGVSAGVSFLWSGDHIIPLDEMKRRADLAMYYAKHNGRNRMCIYSDAMEQALDSQKSLEIDLSMAVSKGEMMLLYQPIFSLSTGEMVGTEALIRWLHPVRGLLSPASFIEIAESSCLIVPIGRWVIETAIKQATLISNNMKISINLSPLQVDDPGLVMCISNALKEYKMPASRVELEITETVMLGRDTHTVETLSAIRSLGVNFALDDFGTGYSSLILLRDFRFDRIKVDRSFITTMLTDKMSQILVEQIVDLAYKMDTRLTIEGVETIQQADYLRQYQNVDIQGYLYGKPMTFEKIMETERNFLTNT